MPISWKTQDAQDRLLAAYIASNNNKVNIPAVVQYYGGDATYDAIEKHLRKSRREAKKMIANGEGLAATDPYNATKPMPRKMKITRPARKSVKEAIAKTQKDKVKEIIDVSSGSEEDDGEEFNGTSSQKQPRGQKAQSVIDLGSPSAEDVEVIIKSSRVRERKNQEPKAKKGMALDEMEQSCSIDTIESGDELEEVSWDGRAHENKSNYPKFGNDAVDRSHPEEEEPLHPNKKRSRSLVYDTASEEEISGDHVEKQNIKKPKVKKEVGEHEVLVMLGGKEVSEHDQAGDTMSGWAEKEKVKKEVGESERLEMLGGLDRAGRNLAWLEDGPDEI